MHWNSGVASSRQMAHPAPPRGLGQPPWPSRQGGEVWLSWDTQPWEQGEQGRPQKGKGIGVGGRGLGAIMWGDGEAFTKAPRWFHWCGSGCTWEDDGRQTTQQSSAASPGRACQPRASSRESSHAPALQADSSFRDGTEDSETSRVGIYSVCNAEEKRCSLGTGLYF